MMFNRKSGNLKSKKFTESLFKPNVQLEIDDRAEYQQIIRKERNLGYKGLYAAFTDKVKVKLIILTDDDQSEQVIGTVSHYDENYSQLVIMSGNSLKRLTFDKIIDVQFPEGGFGNEELSD